MIKKTAGFTLIELLVVLAIIAVLATIIFLRINPLELNKKARDAVRLADLTSTQQAINMAVQETKKPLAQTLCTSLSPPCQEFSYPVNSSTRNSDGSGWIKINFKDGTFLNLPVLPIDPLNNVDFHYQYYSDGENWEINAVLESDQYKVRMDVDGGNNINKYEIGTNLFLISN